MVLSIRVCFALPCDSWFDLCPWQALKVQRCPVFEIFFFVFANWLTRNGVAVLQVVSHKFHATFFVKVLSTHLAWSVSLEKKQSFLHETNLKKLEWRLLNTRKIVVCGLHAKSFVLHSNKAMATRCHPSSLPEAFAMKRPYVIKEKNVTNTSEYAIGNHSCIGKHETCSHLNFPAKGKTSKFNRRCFVRFSMQRKQKTKTHDQHDDKF